MKIRGQGSGVGGQENPGTTGISKKSGNGWCAALVALVLFLGCARQMPPPGGPIDRTPPVVVSTEPADAATDVPLDRRIRIEFSKGMDRRSVERAVFISPQPARAPQMRWDGKTLEKELNRLLADIADLDMKVVSVPEMVRVIEPAI